MEVNEKIVEEYIKLIKEWFYMTDISFNVPQNYSNIDLLAYDHKNDIYYDMEIKYRSAYYMSKTNTEDFDKYINQLTRNERKKKIIEIIGKNKTVIKVFITTKKLFGKTDENEKRFIAALKKRKYIGEVWYFDDIIPELYHALEEKGRYNTELTQTIRLIKTYIK
jgi:hypothetical protein